MCHIVPICHFSVDLENSHKYSHTYLTRDSRQFTLFKEFFTKSVGPGRFSAITTNPFRKILTQDSCQSTIFKEYFTKFVGPKRFSAE